MNTIRPIAPSSRAKGWRCLGPAPLGLGTVQEQRSRVRSRIRELEARLQGLGGEEGDDEAAEGELREEGAGEWR